jgi:hypothetical protein
MKLLRELFHLRVAGRLSPAGRREVVRRTITVPAPLAHAGNVVELRRVETEAQPVAHAADEPPRYAMAANQ